MRPNYILGISAFYHDSAAALLRDGEIIAAAQEERFTRIKHDAAYPEHAVNFCLAQAGISADQISHVIFYEKPLLKFERLLETYLSFAPKGFSSFRKAIPLWISEKLFQKTLLLEKMSELSPDIDWNSRYLFSEHHLSHAASAFFPSPFEEALVLTMDGVGEHATTSAALGIGNKLNIFQEINFPHSIGLLYSAFTFFLGFKVNSGEYKVMGLAPYGQPKYVDLILRDLIDVKEDGSFHLNQKYFDYCVGLKMTNSAFANLFQTRPRSPEAPLEQIHMDLAASIQAVTEIIVIKLCRNLQKQTGAKNICLAGGVALNCVANGKLAKEKIFSNIWIQPAAGDSGGALGAAYVAHYLHQKNPRAISTRKDAMHGSYLGPEYSNEAVVEKLKKIGAKFHLLEEAPLLETTAQALKDGKAVGWHQGRMEFGPRALGARSILGDPRSPQMQKELNLKVKFRESFRPFAPAVLAENAQAWFDLPVDSPYMLLVAPVVASKQKQLSQDQKKLSGLDLLNVERSEIPAVTHVDNSARIQTVSSDLDFYSNSNARFHKLLTKFNEITNCPVLVNTSFNIRGEPIVCSPEDSYRCFMGTNIDVLVIENCLLYKNEQPKNLQLDYKTEFALD